MTPSDQTIIFLVDRVVKLYWLLGVDRILTEEDAKNILTEWRAIAELYRDKSYLVEDPAAPVAGDWLVVVDDSDCTVKVGGHGHMWQLEGQSKLYKNCWKLKGVGSPYDKKIFRKDTKKEVNWLKTHKS